MVATILSLLFYSAVYTCMFCYFTDSISSVLPAKERRRRQLYNCRRQLDTVTGEQNVLEKKGVELEQKIRNQEEGMRFSFRKQTLPKI